MRFITNPEQYQIALSTVSRRATIDYVFPNAGPRFSCDWRFESGEVFGDISKLKLNSLALVLITNDSTSPPNKAGIYTKVKLDQEWGFHHHEVLKEPIQCIFHIADPFANVPNLPLPTLSVEKQTSLNKHLSSLGLIEDDFLGPLARTGTFARSKTEGAQWRFDAPSLPPPLLSVPLVDPPHVPPRALIASSEPSGLSGVVDHVGARGSFGVQATEAVDDEVRVENVIGHDWRWDEVTKSPVLCLRVKFGDELRYKYAPWKNFVDEDGTINAKALDYIRSTTSLEKTMINLRDGPAPPAAVAQRLAAAHASTSSGSNTSSKSKTRKRKLAQVDGDRLAPDASPHRRPPMMPLLGPLPASASRPSRATSAKPPEPRDSVSDDEEGESTPKNEEGMSDHRKMFHHFRRNEALLKKQRKH